MNPDDPQVAPQPTLPPFSLSPDQLPDPPPPVSDSPVSPEIDPAPVSAAAAGPLPESRPRRSPPLLPPARARCWQPDRAVAVEINAQVRVSSGKTTSSRRRYRPDRRMVTFAGVPGFGKTHLVLALTCARRVDFGASNLLPTSRLRRFYHTLYDMGSGEFKVRRGPVFTNLLLADEINRALASRRSPPCSKSCRNCRSPSTAIR
ncbi:MAG: AAA family ATPase [Verrucomicrobiales bacterium]